MKALSGRIGVIAIAVGAIAIGSVGAVLYVYPVYFPVTKFATQERAWFTDAIRCQRIEGATVEAELSRTWSNDWYIDGVVTISRPDHIIIESTYVDGVRHGIEVELCRLDGSTRLTRRTAYVDGHKEGEERLFFVDGELRECTRYHEGFRHGVRRTFYPNGAVRLREEYDYGTRNGERLRYYPDGRKRSIMRFSNGLAEGRHSEYFPDESIKYTCEYSAGVLVGKSVFYNEDGEAERTVFYGKHGQVERIVRRKAQDGQ